MAKKCWKGRSSARIRSFFTIWQHLLAISTWIFEKVVPEDVRALFCRSETISKVGNIKIMSASSFFLLALSPNFLYLLHVWFATTKTQFLSLRWNTARQIFSRTVPFSKIQVYIGKKCCQNGEKWPNSAADFGISWPFGNICMPVYTRIFENGTARLRCAHFRRNDTETGFLSRSAYKPHGREKRREGREGRRKKDCWHSFSFLPVWFVGSTGVQKTQFPCRCGDSSGTTFSKIQVDIASKYCQMVKNDRRWAAFSISWPF